MTGRSPGTPHPRRRPDIDVVDTATQSTKSGVRGAAAAPVRRGRGRNRGGGRGLLREKGRERRTAGDEHTEEIFHRNGEDAVAEELRFAAVKMKDRAVSREHPADAVVVGVEAAAGWGDSRATPDGKPGFEDLERDGNASRFRCRA